MGYDLRGKKRNFHYTIHSFPKVLRLAIKYGWEPMGTLNPDVRDADGQIISFIKPEDWDGNYTTNDWQFVTEDDVKNLANALKKATRKEREEYALDKFIEFCEEGYFLIG